MAPTNDLLWGYLLSFRGALLPVNRDSDCFLSSFASLVSWGEGAGGEGCLCFAVDVSCCWGREGCFRGFNPILFPWKGGGGGGILVGTNYFIHFTIPFGEFGPPYLGKATVRLR